MSILRANCGFSHRAGANARNGGREAEFNEALDQFCEQWNLGTADKARFEQEYLLARAART
jgi:hypothetical protein